MRCGWWWVALVLLAGCGGVTPPPCVGNPSACDDGGVDAGPDAGLVEVDAGSQDGGESLDAGVGDGGLVWLDYRTLRGAPLAATAIAEVRGTAWALAADRFVVEDGCDGGACDLSWRDDTGVERAAVRGVRALNGSAVSRDGRLAALFTPRTQGDCTDGDGFTRSFAFGAWSLLDVATGAALLSKDPVTTTDVLEPAFIRAGRYARLLPFDGSGCGFQTPDVRRTVAPWATPAALTSLSPDTWLADELSDGRLLVSLPGDAMGVVLPDDDSSLFRFTELTGEAHSSGEWVHAFERYPVQSIVALDVAEGVARRLPVPADERDWFEERTSHRFAAVCSFSNAQRQRPCLVLDGAGQLPVARLVHGEGPGGRRQVALAGRQRFAVYLHAETREAVRLDLQQGTHEPLGLPRGLLRVVGDGRGVVLDDGESAFLITRSQVHAVPGRLAAVLSSELAGGPADVPQAQLVFLVTLSASGGEQWLHAWHLGTGRVARLTDSLSFNPPLGSPFGSDTCAVPGFLRSAGAPHEQLHQAASLLHFTEFVPATAPKLRVFVMPVDLSSPPRLVADVDPERCAAPLVALDGSRLWLPVPTQTGVVRFVVAPLTP